MIINNSRAKEQQSDIYIYIDGNRWAIVNYILKSTGILVIYEF